MKVVIINHSDTLGGASVVSLRLMEAMRMEGVDARMLVMKKSGDSPYVEQVASNFRAKVPFIREQLKILANNGFSRRDMFKVSIACYGLPLSEHPMVKDADAVVLNWVNQGMLSLSEIAKIARMKPTLWTMHDMWNMTGICHHAGNCQGYLKHCGNCPMLNRAAFARDISFRTFARKKRLYAAAPITFIAVSNWLGQKAKESPLLADQQGYVIHNAFPVNLYAQKPNFTRHQLGLPQKGKIILFCAARIDDPIKGLPLAVDALNSLAESHGKTATAVFVGELRDPSALRDLSFPYVTLGAVSNRQRIRSIMAYADVVLSTSSFESLPTVLIEGQASGATPVGYVHDGRADIITDGETGYAIRPEDYYKSHDCYGLRCRLAETSACRVVATAEAIRRALDAPIPLEKLRAAARRFAFDTVAQRYLDVIDDLIYQQGVPHPQPDLDIDEIDLADTDEAN